MNQPACNTTCPQWLRHRRCRRVRSITGRDVTAKTYLDVEDLQVYQKLCQFNHLSEKERRWAVAETAGEYGEPNTEHLESSY